MDTFSSFVSVLISMTLDLAPDKRRYMINIFFISASDHGVGTH